MAKFYKSELTVSCESNSRNRNYLGVLMSIVVLMLISTMIVAAIVIINPEIVTFSTKPYTPREAITLEESMLGELSPNNFDFQWLSSSSPPSSSESSDPTKDSADELLFDDSKNLNTITMPSSGRQTMFNRFEPNITTLISNSSLLSSIEYQGFKISPSRRYLLIWTKKRKQFRHTFTAKYFLYDIKLELISMLSTQRAQQNTYESLDSATQYLNDQDEGNEFNRFQLVDWFADNDTERCNDFLILIQSNDIFILSHIDKSQHAAPTRITFTGKANEIFNGVPDWLYEEEILADVPAFQVSPKSTSLAYMSFNDSQVDLMPFSIYGEQLIPRTQQIRYPKAGRVNPRVTVHIIDSLTTTTTTASDHQQQYKDIELRLPDDLGQRQHYINRIKWLTDDKLGLIWLNRNQNESHYVVCSRETGWRCEKNLYISATGGWLDLSDDLIALDDDHYLTLLFKNEGPEVGSFKHIAKVSLKQTNTYNFITAGRKEVVSINGIDKKRSIVYYTSTPLNEPGQRQLYWAQLETPERGACVTCDHHPGECLYNYAKLSPSTNYYIFECEGPGVPRTELRATRIDDRQRQILGSLPKLPLQPLAKLINDGAAAAAAAKSSSFDLNNLPLSPGNYIRKDSHHHQHQQPQQHQQQQLQRNDDTSLLWTVEDNSALRDRLIYSKAMPLTMRLKVPIANTNYSANVIMLLPPQLGSSTTFRAPPSSLAFANFRAPDSSIRGGGGQSRPRRSAIPIQSGVEQALHSHFTPDSITEYTSRLTSGQQYPMVVDVYAGPGSQKVDYRFHIGFGHYLASSRRTIYVMIDGRGSGYQGTKRLYEIYRKFGTVEIQDQIEVASYLTRNFSFIDPSKVAIWGWSYGGYAAAMALAQSNARSLPRAASLLRELHLFKDLANSSISPTSSSLIQSSPPLGGVFECAASVAPVTNWIYYDTAYTERYMLSPYLNEFFDKTTSGDHNYLDQALDRQPFHHHHHNSSNISEQTNKWFPLNKTIASFAPSNKIVSGALDLNERYRLGSLLEHIGQVDRKRFLLIHGTADDNVHFQQSIMLMKRLIQKNVMFETRLYPDQDHGIANKADKLHLGSTLSNFFAECFDMAY